MLNKEQKTQVLSELTQKLSSSTSVIFTSFKGLKIHDLEILRKSLKKENISFNVVKNTLLKRAFGKKGFHLSSEMLAKPLVVAFGNQDEISPAKIIAKFIKENSGLEIVGGIWENNLVDASMIESIALLPGREELNTRLVGSLASPMARFVFALRWNGYAVTSVLNQYLKLNQSQN